MIRQTWPPGVGPEYLNKNRLSARSELRGRDALTGKVAIVTGASRGIGQAVALELARGGAATLLTARTDKTCEPVATAIRTEGGRAETVASDVSRYADAQRLAETALEHYGRIDILVNNAGVIEPISTLESCEPDTWTQNIMVNLIGVFYCCRVVLPRFRQTGGGSSST